MPAQNGNGRAGHKLEMPCDETIQLNILKRLSQKKLIKTDKIQYTKVAMLSQDFFFLYLFLVKYCNLNQPNSSE